MLMLAGCAAPPAGSAMPDAPRGRTLDSNPLAPFSTLRLFYDADKWNVLKNMEYAGYVIYNGTIRDDGSVRLGRIREAWPDESRNRLAQAFAATVRINALSVGTRVAPRAEVFVFFYETDPLPGWALVIGQQAGGPVAHDYAMQTVYLTVIHY
jgi:hypothetical protein